MEPFKHQFADITEEEEARLPLPNGWISLIKIPVVGAPGGAVPIRSYKNVRLSIESSEHPYILQAQGKVKKMNLPEGWALRTASVQGGESEVFYHNAELDFSMWDHPLLRNELCDLLSKAGHNPVALGIKREVSQPRPTATQSAAPIGQVAQQTSLQVNDKKTGSVASSIVSNRHDDQSARASLVAHSNLLASPSMASAAQSDRSVGISELDRSAITESDASLSDQSAHISERVSQSEMSRGRLPTDDSAGELYLDLETPTGGTELSAQAHSGASLNSQAFTPQYSVQQEESVQSESVVDNHRDWESVLHTYKDPGTDLDRTTHRVKHIKPPVTVSGIRVLREDVMEANERVHHLMMKLRSLLSTKSGIQCSMLYHQDPVLGATSPGKAIRNNVTLASDIVTALRQRPEYIVLAMANSNNLRDGSPVMVQIAFTMLHRLLHPFSADNSMTTAILLQGINYQLDELTPVEQVFSELDSKVIIARALFITDPDTAVRWDPLLSPLPTVPEAKSETVLACLLRVYAIRRDVTSYYRTIWRPILPGVVALLKQHSEAEKDPQSHHNIQAHAFANTIAVANRLLECTLGEKSILTFPPIATAVCRAVHEIGGQLALHTYLFQLLILPNLLKVLAGDHESTENEDIYRVDNVDEIVNKYYDSGFWFKKPGAAQEEAAGPGILDPLRTLIWLVWRIYTCSVFMSETAVTALTMQDFLTDSKPIALDQHAYAYPPMRLRNMLRRLRRKIERGCAFLLTMPMDAQGSEYLGVNEEEEEGALDSAIQKLESRAEMVQLFDRRVHSLHFKPNEMLNLTIASKYEIGALFSDVALAMEMHDQAAKSPIYQAIAEYLNHNMDYDSEQAHEHLMELSFLYVTDDFGGYDRGGAGVSEEKAGQEPSELVASRYDQLLRGLRLSNRYEDSLIKMIARLESGCVSSLFELAEDESWFHAPEFDANVKSDTVRLAKQHTAGSISKKKSAHHGLARAAQVPVFPLMSQHNPQDHHPNHKSLKALQHDVIKSYRFHTSAPSADAGTSIARPKVLPPKVHPSSIVVTTTEAKSTAVSRHRSRYTKVEINPHSSILAPTQNKINQKNPLPENPQQEHNKFLKSLRDHSIIPTNEFQARYQKVVNERRRHKRELLERQLSGSRDDAVPQEGVGRSARVLKPFPEHLRNRLYGLPRQQQQEGPAEAAQVRGRPRQRSRSTSPQQRGRQWAAENLGSGLYGRGRPQYEVQGEAESPHSLAQEIIREYSNLFSGPASDPTRRGASDRPQFMYVSRDTHHRSISPPSMRGRSRSPGLPEPLPAQTRFQSPTRALLHRLTDNSEQVVRDAVELRKYERNTDFEGDEPFSPTALKMYPPQGLRVPRVPDFLYNEEISDYSRSVSRASSRSLSRSNSFSSSPVRGRSRDNSFSDLRHVCKRDPPADPQHHQQYYDQPEYEQGQDEEYLPISEPSTPVQVPVPVPNVVNVELPMARDAERRAAAAAAAAEVVADELSSHSSGGSSLSRHKKVNISLVQPAASVERPAAAAVAAKNVPPVVTIAKPPQRLRNVGEQPVASLANPPATVPSATTAPIRPEPVRVSEGQAPAVIIQSQAAAPLSPPLMMRAPRTAAASSVPPAQLQEVAAPAAGPPQHPVRMAMEHSQPAPAPLPNPPAPQQPPQLRAEQPAVGFQYAVTFQPRMPGEETPSHVYDVNAAYEEAFQRAKASMHRGDASDGDGSDEDGEDDVRCLENGQVLEKRGSMRSTLMQKQKSKSRRASKLLVEDDQVVSFLTKGFQAIKHGRSGKSKAKVLRYNPSLRLLEWEDLGTDRLRVFKSFFRRNSNGAIVGGDEGTSCIALDTVKSVYTGVRTEVMMRAGLQDPACCLSIVTDSRSLDLTLPSATERDRVVRGLKIILEGREVPFL